MPTYTFHCSNCHDIFDEMRTIPTRSNPAECPTCHYEAHRDLQAEWKTGTRNKGECLIWYSESMGCQPHEVEEFKKSFPGSEYTPDGRLVCRGLKHREAELKRRGYIDYR
jgi:putative FmdB family regulatory protein